MMATLLDGVNKELDMRGLEKERRYEAFLDELARHVRNIQTPQTDLAERLDTLEQQESKKITSESYTSGSIARM
jgi:cell division cycle protein 37